MHRQRALVSLLLLLLRTLILLDQGPTLMTSFNLNYLLTGPISKYSHTGVRALMYEFEGDANIQSIALLSPLLQTPPHF